MPRNVLVGISPTDPVTLAAVVAGLVLVTLITTRRVVHYDEPRYRAGLWLNVGDGPSPAAIGGVLAGWQGRPPGVEAAHVRFFLEPWATVRSGQVIDSIGYRHHSGRPCKGVPVLTASASTAERRSFFL